MEDIVYAYHASLLDVPDTKKARVRAVEEFVNKALVTGSNLDYYASLAIQLDTYAKFGMRRKCEYVADKLICFRVAPEHNVFPWVGRTMLESFKNYGRVLRLTRKLLSQEYSLDSDVCWLIIHLRILEAKCLLGLNQVAELSDCVSELSKLASFSWAGSLAVGLVASVPDTVLSENAPRLIEKMLAEGTDYSLCDLSEALGARLLTLAKAGKHSSK